MPTLLYPLTSGIGLSLRRQCAVCAAPLVGHPHREHCDLVLVRVLVFVVLVVLLRIIRLHTRAGARRCRLCRVLLLPRHSAAHRRRAHLFDLVWRRQHSVDDCDWPLGGHGRRGLVWTAGMHSGMGEAAHNTSDIEQPLVFGHAALVPVLVVSRIIVMHDFFPQYFFHAFII